MLIVYVGLILDLDAMVPSGISVAIGYLVGAAGNNGVVITGALWVRLKVHVAGRPALGLCKLALRTIIVDFLCPRGVPEFDTLAASEAAEGAGIG